MGSSPSKAVSQPQSAPLDEKRTDIVSELSSLRLTAPLSADGSLSKGTLQSWEQEASTDLKAKLARTVLQHTDISALASRSVRIQDAHIFNHVVDFKSGPITNQKSSGRCWIFAATNVIRYGIQKTLKLSEFELSQNYLFFWDKLNKANYYLELSIEHADLPIDDRLVNHLSGDLVSDGGQWDMVINLIERYGLVPQSVYPESHHSSLSGPLNSLVKTKLREHALILRRLSSSLRASFVSDDILVATLRAKKEELLKEIYSILTATLGVPPSPDERFTWEYTDSDGKFGKWEGTPLEYAKAFASKPYPVSDSFSLINDPRNEYSKLYTVDKLGNVWGGRPVLYVNTEAENLKKAVVKLIKAGQPVFFGCDVGKFSDRLGGILDTALYEYEVNAFDITLGLTKAERLQVNESAMTHAMVISGVHLDDNGKPVRYKVENSWGEAAGVKGWFVMTDAWFEQFVYQIVVPKALAPKDLVQVFESGEKVVLPPWDPMNTLRHFFSHTPFSPRTPTMSKRSGLGFLAAVGGVMGALKLKQRWDDYNPVSSEEEGRVALSTASPRLDDTAPPYTDSDDVTAGLLNSSEREPYKRKRTGCCLIAKCSCTLFWKAFGIVAAGFAIYYAVKLIIWAVSDAPTGLELMPAFSSSLGCLSAPHIYNTTKMVITAPMGSKSDHAFDIRGSAVGTFVIAQGAANLQDVKYELTLRSADPKLLDDIVIQHPEIGSDGSVLSSRLLINTPRTGPDSGCMRYDIKMYVPPDLKKLHVQSHTTMHIQFDSAADVELDTLYVTVYSMSKDNLVLPSRGVRGNLLGIEVFRGWIVGDVAVVNSTTITTQRGDGITNIRAHPTAPLDSTHPDPALFRTTTGAGRTDVFYITPKAFKRPIQNVHMSSRNADMYLTYKEAEFSGLVELDSTSFTATGLQRLPEVPGNQDDGQTKWTHWRGDKDGGDEIFVRSRGWSGLYF
ncbi:hypothetical protein DXG03_000609 [Asterophora parasitica]|uniref:Cysteine proteinase 1, mitochondrial n=1 Tax=Asterophora parasitica TaxID=117018 RepID=A0A9P7K9M9_9AGAR|nr:hypothetical protein DXG03_000609 [Asterophora parasitica]